MKKERSFGLLSAALFCAMICSHAFAAPAPPYPVKYTLPDGTDITLKVTGDEFFMYTTTLDGYNVVMEEDGYYYYAEDAGGRLGSTGVRASDPGRRSAAERAVLSRVLVGAPPWAEEASMSSPLRKGRAETAATVPQHVKEMRRAAMNSGEEYRSLTILVQFQDVKFTTPNPVQAFGNLLNQEGYSHNGATGSAADYFKYNSNGRFDPKFDVVGPVTVSEPISFYDMAGANRYQMIEEAVALVDDEVDFSLYADNGTIRDIFIFFAGEANMTSPLWPHSHRLDHSIILDGVILYEYACSSEFEVYSSSEMSNIGVFCHEFGHVIGLPDFYDVDSNLNGMSVATGRYLLMDTGPYNNGGRTPPSMTAIERMLMGWLTPKELDANREYTIAPVSEDDAYVIYTDTEDEYFLIETRNGEDANGPNVWDEKLGAEVGITGQMPIMMVYHVDRSQNIVGGGYTAIQLWDMWSVNKLAYHECFKVVRAEPSSQSGWGYPGPAGVTSLSSRTNSDFKPWSGENMLEEFTSITTSGNNIVATFFNGMIDGKYMTVGEVGDNYAEIRWNDFPYTGGFTVELYDDSNTLSQRFETTDKAAFLSMLRAEVIYKLKVTAKGTGEFDEMSFRTAAVGSEIPLLPLKGTYAEGEIIPLRLTGMAERVVSAEWAVNGEAVVTAVTTPPAGRHTISVRVVLEDGNEEVFTKTVTVR